MASPMKSILTMFLASLNDFSGLYDAFIKTKHELVAKVCTCTNRFQLVRPDSNQFAFCQKKVKRIRFSDLPIRIRLTSMNHVYVLSVNQKWTLTEIHSNYNRFFSSFTSLSPPCFWSTCWSLWWVTHTKKLPKPVTNGSVR